MKRALERVWSILGLDQAIAYSVSARGLGLIMQPVRLVMIALFLSEREQGYYFTFFSVLGLTMFFNLGLTNVLQIFASHEKAELKWGAGGLLTGSESAMGRLRALLRLGILWFGGAALLVLVILLPVGAYFFSSQDPDSHSLWLMPWACAVGVAAMSCLMGPVLSILEGCGRVKEMRRLWLVQTVLSNPVLWFVLIMGGGLYAGPLFSATGVLIALYWVFRTHAGFLRQNVSLKREAHLSWREIWPLQWRTALGWVSGYLIYQLFIPMTFAFVGPKEAGQVGISLMATMQGGTIAMYWIDTKLPRMGEHWARREYKLLDKLFVGAFLRMVIISLLGFGALYTAVVIFSNHELAIMRRFIQPPVFLKLMVLQVLNNIIMAQSMYLRANKREPLVWVAIAQGLLILTANWYLGRRFGYAGMINGSLVITAVGCAACAIVFSLCRRKWQKEGMA